MKNFLHMDAIGWYATLGISYCFFFFGLYFLFIAQNAFLGWSTLLLILVFFLPRFLYHATRWKHFITKAGLGVVESILLLLTALGGIGSLGFYYTVFYYDFALHLFHPIMTGIGISVIVGSWLFSQGRFNLNTVQRRAVVSTALIVFLWEGWEYGGDQIFGTMMLGQIGEAYDTLYDILAGLFALFGTILLNHFFLNRFLLWLHR